MHPKIAAGIANSVDPDQIDEPFDLGLLCLPRPICPKTWDHYGMHLLITTSLQNLDNQQIAVIILKFEQRGFTRQ